MTEGLIEQIQAANANRLPNLLSLKYEAMTENAFRFYRASPHLFYHHIAGEPALDHGPMAWLCGDMHLENFGSFRSDNRLVYFDLNDYDDAALGPVTWEVARLLASIFVGFSALEIGEKKAEKLASVFINSYIQTLKRGKAVSIETRNANGIVGDFLNKVAKRRQRDLLRKRTSRRHNKLEILMDHQKHLTLPEGQKEQLMHHVQEWIKTDERSPYNYKVTDAIFRIAGTGSLGLHRYVMLLKSSNHSGEKYLLIDMKESAPSSLLPYLTVPQPVWESEAERVVSIQTRMQDRSPALLSTSRFEGRSYLMQEMQPEEDNISFRLLADRYRDMYTVIDSMAMLSASAQLRSSGQRGSATTDELQDWALRDAEWPGQVLDFARRFAKTVHEDYGYFCAQYASGVIR